MELRKHQEECIESIEENFLENKKGLIKMFCGSGKSLIIYHSLLKYCEKLSVLVVPSINLITQFNNDYMLLKKYLKYYSNYGVDIFFLYYNKKIDNSIIDNLIKLNDNNYKIYLIEWDYSYWWFYNGMKHHHAQTMAINDSLNILKNYCSYILYNDLDEYIKMENIYWTIYVNKYSKRVINCIYIFFINIIYKIDFAI